MDLKRFATRALYATLMTGGITLLGAGVAHAAETGGDDGVLSGTQAGVSIDLPINLSGNGISVLGDASSSGAETTTATPAEAPAAPVTSGDEGVASGSQAIVDVSIPVTIGGNAISVLGDTSSTDASTEPAAAPAAPAAPAEAPATSGDDSVLGGTQGLIDVAVPVTIGGNAISVLGDSSSEGATNEAATGTAGSPGGDSASTSGDDGILGGSQLIGGVEAPVNVGGNAISVIGDSSTEGATTESTTGEGSWRWGDEMIVSFPHGSDAWTTGDEGVASGTQVGADAVAPVTVGGNAISVIGDSWSEGSTSAVAAGTGSGTTDGASTDGDDSVLGGTQGVIDAVAPVTVGGNAISVIGDSSTDGATNAVVPGTGTGTGTGSGEGANTSGDDGILGGTQLGLDAVAPVTVGGNAISVIGDSSTDGATNAVVPGTGTGSGEGASTSGDDGILGGTQLLPDVSLPVTVGGNAISVVGDSSSTDAETVVVSGAGGSGDATTGGSDGLLGGTQLIPGIELPITIGGNAISVIGDSETEGPTTVVIPGEPTEPGTPIDPTDPVDPVDPVDPTDPGTPVDPTDPTDPTTPGTPGDDGSMTPGSSVAGAGDVTVIAAGVSSTGMLASTGADVAGLAIAGGLVLLAGLLLFGFRRFAARN